MKMHSAIPCGLALAASGAVAPLAGAGLILQSDSSKAEGPPGVAFIAQLEYTALSSSTGRLDVSLANTSQAGVGGYITGLLFNFESADAKATLSLAAKPNNSWSFASGNGQPFGHGFEAGAALGGNWQGGGNPSSGVPVGGTGAFAFNVSASDASSLSASSFASGPYEFDFIVRFRGLSDGGSAKVPGIAAVPTPGGMALAGLGLVALASRRRPR